MPQERNRGTVFIEGTLKWVRLVRPNQYGSWEVVCYPNKEGMDILYDLKKKGVKNTIKKDDDGYYMSFRRPVSKMIKGKDTQLSPPLVVGSNGEAMDGGIIGNGSSGICQVEWYKYKVPGTFSNSQQKEGIAIRLVGVKVTDLIEFRSNIDFPPDEKPKYQGLLDHEPVY